MPPSLPPLARRRYLDYIGVVIVVVSIGVIVTGRVEVCLVEIAGQSTGTLCLSLQLLVTVTVLFLAHCDDRNTSQDTHHCLSLSDCGFYQTDQIYLSLNIVIS